MNDEHDGSMTPHAIVSYDDTQDDHDALMLGRVLRAAGATLTLAYVRHAVAPGTCTRSCPGWRPTGCSAAAPGGWTRRHQAA